MNCPHCELLGHRCKLHRESESYDCIETMKNYVENDLCFVCSQPREICRGKQLRLDEFEGEE